MPSRILILLFIIIACSHEQISIGETKWQLNDSLTVVNGFSQVQPFQEFDFSDGEYYLLGFSWGGADKNELADSLGEWYTDEIDVLNEFKSEWVFDIPGKRYACGYHYEIHLSKNGKSIKKFLLNLNCNEIVTDEGCFYFDTDLLQMFYGKLQKPKRENKSFNNYSEAREYLNLILKDSNLIFTPTPHWNDYQGTLGFDYECSMPTGKSCYKIEDEILEKLTLEIKNKYPNEKFELSVVGLSSDKLGIEVKGYKSLHDKFNLYPLNWRSWTNFNFNLKTYWKNEKLYFNHFNCISIPNFRTKS